MFLIIASGAGRTVFTHRFKFFLYTFLGSVLMLVAMVMMYADAGTTCIGGCEVSPSDAYLWHPTPSRLRGSLWSAVCRP